MHSSPAFLSSLVHQVTTLPPLALLMSDIPASSTPAAPPTLAFTVGLVSMKCSYSPGDSLSHQEDKWAQAQTEADSGCLCTLIQPELNNGAQVNHLWL